MLVEEKKYRLDELTKKTYTIEKNDHSFIILDDKTSVITPKINKLFDLINSYDYDVSVIDIEDTAALIARSLKNKQFDTIVTIGMGGKQVYNSIKNESLFMGKNVYLVKWNRKWENDKSLGFDTNIDCFDFENKSVVLLEDVIASGNTLFTIMKEIENMGGDVEWIYSSLIQESSPIINNSFCNTLAAVVIKSPENKNLDPFWYPPIYSLRHLLYGDIEMENFYNILNEKYFNNEKVVETYIKKIRR